MAVARKTGKTKAGRKSPFRSAVWIIGSTRSAARAAKTTETSRGCFSSHAPNSSGVVILAAMLTPRRSAPADHHAREPNLSQPPAALLRNRTNKTAFFTNARKKSVLFLSLDFAAILPNCFT
jgi:hypothetical protein